MEECQQMSKSSLKHILEWVGRHRTDWEMLASSMQTESMEAGRLQTLLEHMSDRGDPCFELLPFVVLMGERWGSALFEELKMQSGLNNMFDHWEAFDPEKTIESCLTYLRDVDSMKMM